ncbi:protein of unknown function [Aminobacter niigataensis]|nr:protein of unknown function [Aminobacter niigataensis]
MDTSIVIEPCRTDCLTQPARSRASPPRRPVQSHCNIPSAATNPAAIMHIATPDAMLQMGETLPGQYIMIYILRNSAASDCTAAQLLFLAAFTR